MTGLRAALRSPLTDLTEQKWSGQLIGTKGYPGIARQLQWRVYHTLRSKGSQPGFPDWVLVRERVVYLELKTEARDSRLTDAQREWVLALLNAGQEIYVARPRHLPELAKILSCRGDPFLRRDVAEVAARLREQTRKEAEA